MTEQSYKEYILSTKELICYNLFYSLFLFLSGMLFFRNVIIAAALVVLAPTLLKNRKVKLQKERNKRIRNGFCDVLQIISVSLASGKNVNKAFIDAASELAVLYGNKQEIIVKEFFIIEKKLSMNQSVEESLKSLAERTECEEIQSFREAESLCRQTGGNIVEITRNTYQTILQKNEIEDEIDVICSEQRMSFRILSFMPFILMFLMSTFSPDYMDSVFSPQGRLFVAAAIFIISSAYVIGTNILNDKVSKQNEMNTYKDCNLRLLNIVTDKIIILLRKYTGSRKTRTLFTELYDNQDELYYRRHIRKQFYVSIIVLIIYTMMFITMQYKPELILLFILSEVGIFIVQDRFILDKALKRRKIIESEMPAFLSKLAILTDAGITVRTAVEKITFRMPEGVLQQQLILLLRDFKYGKSNEICFENFARRCKTKGASSFSTLVLQNIKKGGKEFSAILRIYAKTSWEKRKAEIKINGEAKAMKLMMPTMMIFIGLMLLMAAPAIINMNMI